MTDPRPFCNPNAEVLLRERMQVLASSVEVALIDLARAASWIPCDGDGLMLHKAIRSVSADLRAAVDATVEPFEPRDWLSQPD